MIKKITLILIVFVGSVLGQVSNLEGRYTTFSSRNFVKFNSFLTIPTFSLVHQEDMNISALVRSSHTQFEDAPSIYMLSASGKLQENIGAGITVYQQEVGIFKDLGFVGNFSNRVKMDNDAFLTFGMNFIYGVRSASAHRVFTESSDKTLQNYQAVPILILQPAFTYSVGNIDAGLHFDNLLDYNIKLGESITGFAEKNFSAHLGYNYYIEERGLFDGVALRSMLVVKKYEDGFGYGGNLIGDLPKLGWVKLAYDNVFGIEAGLGVNINQKIGVGFNYGKTKLGTTTEIGLLYNLSKRETKRRLGRPASRPNSRPTKVITKSDPLVKKRLKAAQDSIYRLNNKMNKIMKLLEEKNKVSSVSKRVPGTTKPVVEGPKVIKTTEPVSSNPVAPVKYDPIGVKDTSLKRSKYKPWREQFVEVEDTSEGGGGGTMYYVCLYQFRSWSKLKKKIKLYKRRGLDVKSIKNPKNNMYFIYTNRFANKKKAIKMIKEINGQSNGVDKKGNKGGDSLLKLRGSSGNSDPVFMERITIKKGVTTKYKKLKNISSTKVITRNFGKAEKGYYIRVGVRSSKAKADKFVDELISDGFKASYLIDENKNKRHIYIHKTKSKAEAKRLVKNNMNSTYYDAKAIIRVN